MKIYIKNMVCDRCRMVVTNIIDELGLDYDDVYLGEVDFGARYSDGLDPAIEQQLKNKLQHLGFELLGNTRSQLVEKVKRACLEYLGQLDGSPDEKLSGHIAGHVHRDYKYLSNLFSSVEGETIEQYFIRARIEKVKELLVYDESSIGDIAHKTGFSSIAHMSGQFKKITGLTPSHFRKVKDSRQRVSLEKL